MVFQAESVPMSISLIKEKCCIDNDAKLENSLHKLSYQSLITLKTTIELTVTAIESKMVGLWGNLGNYRPLGIKQCYFSFRDLLCNRDFPI